MERSKRTMGDVYNGEKFAFYAVNEEKPCIRAETRE